MPTSNEKLELLLRKPFIRDPAKKQYKQLDGKRFPVQCGCNYKDGKLPANFWSPEFRMLGIGHSGSIGGQCPVCHAYSGIDVSTLESCE